MANEMAMRKMKSACCCATLRTGTLISGWFSLVVDILVTLLGFIAFTGDHRGIILYRAHADRWITATGELGESSLVIILVTLLLVGMTFPIFADVHLLRGTYTKRPDYFVPYLVLRSLELALITVYVFVAGAYLAFLRIGVNIYLICIVRSYYIDLRTEIRAQEEQTYFKQGA